jgi:stearoyl-CoA desaturase (delta-9 desaturase)
VIGRRRYETTDDSKNSFILSLVTLGEGWHNNHHKHMGTVRQGFYWWEIDITYYLLKCMSWTGLIWDLRPVPKEAYNRAKQVGGAAAIAETTLPKIPVPLAKAPIPAPARQPVSHS